jgi:hypothetical protein
MKVVRVMLLARHAWQEVFRMLHPQAVTLLKFGDRVIPERLRLAFLGFFFIYIAALAVGTLIMALYGLPLGEAFGSVFSCLNITGVALGPVGDASFFARPPPPRPKSSSPATCFWDAWSCSRCSCSSRRSSGGVSISPRSSQHAPTFPFSIWAKGSMSRA